LGISPADIKVIARGAFLHDIGKMAIPDDILHKPGRLTPEELDIIRDHCSHGYEMLRKIPSIAEVAEIVLTHHERYDGKGYPRGLCGGEIPSGPASWQWPTPSTPSPATGPFTRRAASTRARRDFALFRISV